MSDEMEIVAEEGETRSHRDSTEDCEMELESPRSEKHLLMEKKVQSVDVANSVTKSNQNHSGTLKLNIPNDISKEVKPDQGKISGLKNCDNHQNISANHSPPVLVNSQPFQQDLTAVNDSPFQKPTVCRTHSLGASDPSPFTIRRRPARLAFASQLQSPSAFKRKLQMQSPIRGDLMEEMDENVLKRCNSAPMLNEINDIDARISWPHGSLTPGSVRARRFSATVLPVQSPSAGSAKSTSRLHQLKKEESLEGIQYKETAHEREVQTSIQMYHTCGELSLSDSHESLNGTITEGGDGHVRTTVSSCATLDPPPRSPLPSTAPVNIPITSKQCPNRAIDFTPSNPPHHTHHSSGGGIPSPLTISTGPLCLSPLPPSPTRNLGFSSTGKQCFSPSMQVPVPACLRTGSVSPSPSPTRRTFVTRRRSQSPCVLKPSVLGPIKRKYDSDSEGGCSPKRMYIPGLQTTAPGATGQQINTAQGDSFPPYAVVTPFYPRSSIHRSHSLSSSSVDSDLNVSPSPPQNGVNIGFLPSSHPLGTHCQSRDSNSGSPFQSPLHANPFSNTGGIQEQGRCSSPASSTCSSSSLEGLKDLQPFSQSHLVTHSTSNAFTPTLIKAPVKDRQPAMPSTATSTANVTL